jgi:hypothetical protein
MWNHLPVEPGVPNYLPAVSRDWTLIFCLPIMSVDIGVGGHLERFQRKCSGYFADSLAVTAAASSKIAWQPIPAAGNKEKA